MQGFDRVVGVNEPCPSSCHRRVPLQRRWIADYPVCGQYRRPEVFVRSELTMTLAQCGYAGLCGRILRERSPLKSRMMGAPWVRER